MSYEPIPDGELVAVVTFLEMTERPEVEVPPYPRDTHRALFSKDRRTVVIKEWDPVQSRFDKIGNVLGPAKVGPEGSTFMIGGVAMPREAWEKRPEVIAARHAAETRSTAKPR